MEEKQKKIDELIARQSELITNVEKCTEVLKNAEEAFGSLKKY